MEVTRKNFKEALPLVAESIKKADFLVIDAEFTGLINGRDVSVFDSPQEYYNTLLHGATDFLLIQYGLCAFYWDEEQKHYMNDAYNFYLFPRGRPGPEKMFLCQSSSLDFLAAQGFDFNKLIKEGISYMTETTECRLRESLTERQKSYSNEKETITIPEENKQQIEDICKRVRQFLDENKSDEMEIDRCNAFIRRLLFQELGTRFKNEAFIETKILENKNRVLKVSRIGSVQESKSRDSLKKEKEWEEFEEAVGFSKVARMISQSEKLVIGHNMLLDLIHTLNHFFQPLPGDYLSFKEFAHCMFPRLLDTKYMSSLPPFKDKVNSSVLQHLLATLSEPPFSLPKAESEQGRGYSRTEDKHHEAGYDAYVTGLCFLAMQAHLAGMRGEPATRAPSPNSPALKPFLNKLFLAKTAHQDSPYMNLAGDDPTPSRDHVFHLTFPRDWQRNDINQLFSPFGPITVQFLDETTALVALARREQARDVARAINKHSRVSLVPYAKYKLGDAIQQHDTEELKREVLTALPNACVLIMLTLALIPVYRYYPTQETLLLCVILASPVWFLILSVAIAGFCQAFKSTPESNSRLRNVNSTSKMLKSHHQQIPEKVERTRSNSVSSSSQPATHTARKRTSSGVFHVDEAEPPSKKPDPVVEVSSKMNEGVPNGRRKGEEKKKDKTIQKDKRVIEKFDTEAKTKCVTAFKESDSWD